MEKGNYKVEMHHLNLPRTFRLFWFYVKDEAKDQNALLDFWYAQKLDEVVEKLEEIYGTSGAIPYEIQSHFLKAAEAMALKRGLLKKRDKSK